MEAVPVSWDSLYLLLPTKGSANPFNPESQ
jgi:hypothetical protein